jgi:uncharacterized membrane protein (DUF485 family)
LPRIDVRGDAEPMALYCTCGTELPDNARFCFHCGKPQREEDLSPKVEADEGARAAALSSAMAAAAPPVNFSNPVAVRVALLCASLSALLNVIPFVSFGCCLWISGAGFLSAVLYSRRMGLMLSVNDGARLGWLTGLLSFVISLVLTALNLLLVRSAGGIREILSQSIERMPAQDEVARQVRDFLASPAGLSIFLVSYIVLGFLMMVSLAVAGGALGAKVMEKE